ncbi:MAG: thermonuclease family protein [Thermomicrobiales bacterium]
MPAGAELAVVEEVLNGDTVIVELDDRSLTVELMGIDAPDDGDDDAGECFAGEATDRLRRLLSPGREVWLERPEEVEDGEDSAPRFVWAVNGDGDAYLINRSMVRHGYALAAEVDPNDSSLNLRRLAAAEADASADGVGMWEACGRLEPTTEPAPIALITDCAAFGSFGEAQGYYAAQPDAQPFLDPNFDGRACEVWFGIDAPPPGSGPVALPPVEAPAPSGQGRDGADGAPGRDGNDARSGDSTGEPGDDSEVRSTGD